MNMGVNSRVFKRLKTWDLRKLRNFKEILEILAIDGKVLKRPPERQIQLCYETAKSKLKKVPKLMLQICLQYFFQGYLRKYFHF